MWQYMAVAGAGAEITAKGGAGAENKYFRLHNRIFFSVVDPDPHGSGTFAWIQIRNYCSGSGSS